MAKLTAEALREKLNNLKNGESTAPETPKAPEVALNIFADDTAPKKARNQKEYAELVGEPHPSGQKFFFTRGVTWFNAKDWDDAAKAHIPKDNPNHEIDHDYALALLMSWEDASGCFAYGNPGTGKSVTPQVLCARLNRPFVIVNGMAGAEPSDYLGTIHIQNGDTTFIKAAAAEAIANGWTLLYDEFAKSPATTNMWLQTLTDSRKGVRLYGSDSDDTWLAADSKFRIILADNVRGVGDGMGQFSAEIQDQSTLDRMKYKVKVDYLPQEREVAFLAKEYPQLTEAFLVKAVQLANNLRTAWDGGDIALPFSMRQSINFVDATVRYRDPVKAFGVVFYDTLPEDVQKDAAKKIFNDVVQFNGFKL